MPSDGRFLDAAAAIGRRIAADAVWQHGRCSWMGAVAEPVTPRRAEHRALGPALYGGTAGVGVFLAQLTAAGGEAPVRRAALGALRHAVARAPARREGFHAGSAGIAWAAARGASLLGEEEFVEGARAVLAGPRPAECGPDVVMGGAGSIVGRLALAGILDDPGLVEDAVATGEALVARATVTRHGWSWGPQHLCGLAHGAGGIGWALAELFAAGGDDRFRAGAAGAFAYERSWLDTTTGTWPDLRIGGLRRGAPRPIASPAAGTWCHGEAGIALTRLRAAELLGPGAHDDDAEVALETTRRRLAAALPHEIEELSLCHGAAGQADALLCGAAGAEVATDLGRVVLDRHASAEDWPCGATPGLFLGSSGLGWLFLRLHDPATPSPLLTAVPSGA